VPHPPVEKDADLRRARSRAAELREPLEAAGARTLVVAPGDMHRAKCLDSVVEAVARLDDSVGLVLVGRPVTGYDPAVAVRRASLEHRVTLARGVGDADFLGWISAADVIVDLRHPHRGEVSGSLFRSMQAGRASIVSGTGTYLDLPEGTVVRVAPGVPDPLELAEAIGSLAREPDRREAIGARAQAYMRGLAQSEATAKGYAEAIRATLRMVSDPAAPARDRWARAMAQLGLTESELRLGHGLAYARALDSFKPGA
jgi:glycosyltransferase involved in cell wall biosynthesis